jgi:hypothetical protein
MIMKLILLMIALVTALPSCSAFVKGSQTQRFELGLRSTNPTIPTAAEVDRLKSGLVRICTSKPKPDREEIRTLVSKLEEIAEQVGVGQASSHAGLLSGEWELLYSPEDKTRSSPFFWAFRKAFPENSDQIFGITDSFPVAIKEVGPAFQQINLNVSTQTGRFVSRVKVATLGGAATSIMTTRAAITGIDGIDGICLTIETTKPEDSTILSKVFGPLGEIINENAPPFPSGEALEKIRPGSSQVVLRTSFCDEGLRVSRDGDRPSDIYVWRRREFANFDFL